MVKRHFSNYPSLLHTDLGFCRGLKSNGRKTYAKEPSLAGSRINKTLYLLNYVDNEDYHRQILTQLNRGEGRHAVARAICHGQRGEIRKRYREGQYWRFRTGEKCYSRDREQVLK